MPLLYTHPLYLEHRTGTHPECPERLEGILAHLEETGLRGRFVEPAFEAATPEQIARVHDPAYIESVAQWSAGGRGRVGADTVVSARSSAAARLACGAAIAAVDAVLTGEQKRAVCLVRPPGHHALSDRAMGFCLFNNVAVAAAHAAGQHKLDRVLIVDWDVHHGNGTQEIFYRSEKVWFLSIHRYPFYPGTGDINETGTGPGLSTTTNIPIRFGTPRDDYFSQFEITLEDVASHCRPELVLLSAGFDAHHLDPVGSLGLLTTDFDRLSRSVLEIAEQYAGGRIVSLLEGGYNLEVLPGCVAQHLDVLAPAADAG